MKSKIGILISSTFLIIFCAIQMDAAPSKWGEDPIWDDGQAEVAKYDAERVIYGKVRKYQSVLITVKEDFNGKFYAKADPPYEQKELLPILKLNIVSEIETENYPYRFLTSVFVDRKDVFHLVKMTVGSQEWCGNTFKEFKGWTERPRLVFHSYWGGQGDGSYDLDMKAGDLVEDQLPISLRGLPFYPGYSLNTRILESQIHNKASEPRIRDAAIRVTEGQKIASKAGKIDCWKVEVEMGDMTQYYWFEREYPNILVKFDAPDGRKLLLKDRVRRKYWVNPQ